MYRSSSNLVLLLFLIGAILLTSCDGRKSSHQALKESIEAYKTNNSIEINKYIPDVDFSSLSDTIFDSDYRVSIKTVPDNKSEVIVSKTKDSIDYNYHYRNFVFDVEIYKKNTLWSIEKFDKNRINSLVLRDIKSLSIKDSILKSINVDLEKTNQNLIVLQLIYKIPESTVETRLNLHLNSSGKIEITSA